MLKIFTIGLLLPIGLFAQANRIAGRIDPSHLAAIKGSVHPKALPANDRGRVSPSLPLDFVTLALKPTPAQQADLDRLLASQQDPSSANHRKWLTPEQYADRFGASASDMAQMVAWLEGQGLTIISTARGRNFLNFKGTAAQVETALHTEIHRYELDGETHYANATEPSVPAAIAPFTVGFLGLDDFKWKAPHHDVRPVTDLYYNAQNVLAPGDLWIIYNVLPLFSSSVDITGYGVKLAIIGQSDVNLSDIATYRNDFNLPSNPPVKVLVTGATNPGVLAGDSGESDLDLEMAGAIAPYASLQFVYSQSVLTSVAYAVDQAVAPVISYSYAGCELNTSRTTIAALEPLAQQGNAEGITWISASGDLGAAACDVGHTVAQDGIAVMLPASIPEVTGVGGTTFSEGFGTTYWSQTNGPYYGNSALSYIPEVGWNDSSSSRISSSGGGMSTIYARPSWQTAPGVPGGAVRYVPDVAMAASPNHDGYIVIEGGAPIIVGGTSAAAPVFAGIVLLMNEYLGANGLGNINPNLYKLASSTSNIFHDITTGSNFISCVAGTNGCVGGTLGYSAGPGYDMVTGLGSVNAYNLIQAWPSSQPAITGIYNGASFVNTGLSPGLIFTITGSGLGPATGRTLTVDTSGKISTTLSSVQVLVNNVPAPILYASATQINAVVPYEIATLVGQHVPVQVVYTGGSGPSASALVVSTAPAMFNLGSNQAAVVNQDGTVNSASNPAARGSYISVYATGEGQTSPAGIDGFIPSSAALLSKPNAVVAVSIGQLTSQILYAGTASFDGFFQVNAVVPQSLSPGAAPITLAVGGAASPTLNVYIK